MRLRHSGCGHDGQGPREGCAAPPDHSGSEHERGHRHHASNRHRHVHGGGRQALPLCQLGSPGPPAAAKVGRKPQRRQQRRGWPERRDAEATHGSQRAAEPVRAADGEARAPSPVGAIIPGRWQPDGPIAIAAIAAAARRDDAALRVCRRERPAAGKQPRDAAPSRADAGEDLRRLAAPPRRDEPEGALGQREGGRREHRSRGQRDQAEVEAPSAGQQQSGEAGASQAANLVEQLKRDDAAVAK